MPLLRRAQPKVDAHFHMHYEFSFVQPYPGVRTPVDQDVLDGFQIVKNRFRKRFQIERVAAVLAPHFEQANRALLQDDFLYPGVYVHVEDNYEPILDRAQDYRFMQLQTLGDPSAQLVEQPLDKSRVEEIMDYAESRGLKKFQLHTHGIGRKEFEFLKKLTKGDRVIYLVAGLESLYWSRRYWKSDVKPKEIKDLHGRLLLGTAGISGSLTEIPHSYLQQALEDELGDMVCFESDFILNYLQGANPPSHYSGSIERVTKAVGNHRGILSENVKTFLER